MLALVLLVLSAIPILLYLGWLFIVIIVYRHFNGGRLFTSLKLLAAISLGLAPLHEALVYPLMKNECLLKGGTVFYETPSTMPRDLVVDGVFHNISSRYPLSELLSSGTLDSVTFREKSSYGEEREILSSAEIYNTRSLSFRIAESSNLACGPFFDFSSKASPPGFSPTEKNNCLAIYRPQNVDKYIRLSTESVESRSWRTAFHSVRWEIVKYGLVENNETKTLLRLREFQHEGLKFHFLLGFIQIGAYTCKTTNDPHVSLLSLLNARSNSNKSNEGFAEYAKLQLQTLVHNFWGFDVPDKIYSYQVGFWDHDGISSKKSPLSVTLNIPKHNAPVKLRLMSNVAVTWNVAAAPGQFVLAENSSPENGTSVIGLPHQQTWIASDKERDENFLLKFYLKEITAADVAAFSNKRHCEVSYRARNLHTALEINSCNDARTDP